MEIIPLRVVSETRPRNVAAYARVSTLTEEQLESFNSQREYYEVLIKSHPQWHFVDIYADEGISGTTKDRPEFQRMIKDAKDGKIDLILVKSVSRFARNAADTQIVVHELKASNVEVFFEEQNLSSFHQSSEMVFNMMAMIAENESRSISQNTQWALWKMAEKGIRHLGEHRVFGYTEINGILTPDDNSRFVIYIFESFANGASYKEISDGLMNQGAKTANGNKVFSAAALQAILSNPIYCGDRIIQKSPHQDFLTKKPKWGEEYESIYVENAHEAVISKKLWNEVQKKLPAKRQLILN